MHASFYAASVCSASVDALLRVACWQHFVTGGAQDRHLSVQGDPVPGFLRQIDALFAANRRFLSKTLFGTVTAETRESAGHRTILEMIFDISFAHCFSTPDLCADLLAASTGFAGVGLLYASGVWRVSDYFSAAVALLKRGEPLEWYYQTTEALFSVCLLFVL